MCFGMMSYRRRLSSWWLHTVTWVRSNNEWVPSVAVGAKDSQIHGCPKLCSLQPSTEAFVVNMKRAHFQVAQLSILLLHCVLAVRPRCHRLWILCVSNYTTWALASYRFIHVFSMNWSDRMPFQSPSMWWRICSPQRNCCSTSDGSQVNERQKKRPQRA